MCQEGGACNSYARSLQATPKGPESLVQLQSSGPDVERCAAVVPKFCCVSSLLGEIDVLSAAIEHAFTTATVVLSEID